MSQVFDVAGRGLEWLDFGWRDSGILNTEGAEKKRRVSRENLDWIKSGDVKRVKKGESKTERAAA
jgi:hypothetical protein